MTLVISTLKTRLSEVMRGKWHDESLWQVLWRDRPLRWILGLAVIGLAIFNFARDLNDPPYAFWDESYYVTAIQRYEEGTAQYASHPPLGFMLITAGRHIVGDAKAVDSHELALIKKIDTRKIPEGYSFTGVRLMAGLFGALGGLFFYLICLNLTREAFSAFIFSLLYLFENAFIVHFRAAHLDPFQITFALAAIWVWLVAFQNPRRDRIRHVALFGLLIGLSFMVKVNTLVLLALPGLTVLSDLWRARGAGLVHVFMNGAMKGVAMVGAFIGIVAAVFVLHTVLNPNAPDFESDSGRKDGKYMSAPYKAWLEDKGPLTPTVIWDATNGYFAYMNNDFTGIVKTEKNGSMPALWPVMSKTINYRWDSYNNRTSYVQMVGNVFSWALGLLAVIAALALVMQRHFQKKDWLDTREMDVMAAVLAMWLIFMGVHIWLGTQRVMYIYHYFAGLALSYMLIPLLYMVLKSRFKRFDLYKDMALGGVCAGTALCFIWFSPLTYHQPITRGQCEARNMPFKVVVCQPKPKPTE